MFRGDQQTYVRPRGVGRTNRLPNGSHKARHDGESFRRRRPCNPGVIETAAGMQRHRKFNAVTTFIGVAKTIHP
jgi:hypothetical protein